MSDYWHHKRLEPRITLRLPVTIRGMDSHQRSFEECTYTENVSRTGACILTSHRLNIGSVLEFEALERFKSKARVSIVWVDSEKPENYKMGVKFLDPLEGWVVR